MSNQNITLTDTAKLFISDKEYDLPITIGTENEVGVDIFTIKK